MCKLVIYYNSKYASFPNFTQVMHSKIWSDFPI